MRLRRKCLERRFGKRPLECPILDPIQVGHDAYPVHTCLGGYPGNWGRISLAQAVPLNLGINTRTNAINTSRITYLRRLHAQKFLGHL